MGDKCVTYKSHEFGESYVIFRGSLKKREIRCPNCRSSKVKIKESMERIFRMLNLNNKRAYLKLDTHKVYCQECGKKNWLSLPFTTGKLPMCNSFIIHIVQLLTITTILGVTRFLGLSWRTVKNIDKAHLERRIKQFSYKKLRYISIDEIAIKKGHKYMTIVTDIATGQIIHAVMGRSEKELKPFLKRLFQKAKRLKGVGIDMSAAYISSVKKHLPNISIIFDRFHVTKLLNNTIDKVRREEYTKCHEKDKKVMKGQRFLLLRNFADLDDGKKSSLEHLLETNTSLCIVHSMKEQFRLFWQHDSKKSGARFLAWWIIQAVESGVKELAKTARTLLKHSEGLLSYFVHKIDNGKAEGINNKIKVLKRMAYGFHDQDYFKLKLYNLHKKTYELIG